MWFYSTKRVPLVDTMSWPKANEKKKGGAYCLPVITISLLQFARLKDLSVMLSRYNLFHCWLSHAKLMNRMYTQQSFVGEIEQGHPLFRAVSQSIRGKHTICCAKPFILERMKMKCIIGRNPMIERKWLVCQKELWMFKPVLNRKGEQNE